MRTLRESIEIYKGRKAPEVFDEHESGALRYLQIEDLRPNPNFKFARDPDGVIANENDVIIAWDGANAGTIGFGLEGYIGSTLAILRPDTHELFAPYLGYFLQSKFDYIRGNTTGATIPHVSRDALENLKIEIPSLPEQQRIAALLDRADRLRRTRRYAQQLSDSFLQAVFVEMFGDPVKNPMGWDVEELGEFTELVSSGATPLGGESVYQNTGIRFIRSQNVLMNRFDFSDVAHIDLETHNAMKRSWVKQRDVLLNITGASIGRVACYMEDVVANVNQHVCIIRLKPKSLEPIFVSALISAPKFQNKILSEQSGATRQAFNFEQIKNFRVIVPPPELQQKFARIVQQFERLRAQQREHERQAEHLFQTLLQRAFRGEV